MAALPASRASRARRSGCAHGSLPTAWMRWNTG
nr:MAG TPA: hypothetical protein [Caudoviricetes sp.]